MSKRYAGKVREARRNDHFYRKWTSLRSRCERKESSSYEHYGGRGIKHTWPTFEGYVNDMYDSYLEHVYAYGERNTTIDRIDVNGDYWKDNCRWATYQQQILNRRGSIGKAQARSNSTAWVNTFRCGR